MRQDHDGAAASVRSGDHKVSAQTPVLRGLMQGWPMTVDRLLTHAASYHGARKLSSFTPSGIVSRTYQQVHERAYRVSSALAAAGIGEGDRIATLAMNSLSHLEVWYGIVGIGAVCHTLNPRQPLEQLASIASHAGDRMIFADVEFLPLARAIAAACPCVENIVVLDEAPPAGPGSLEEFLATGTRGVVWGGFSEEAAAGLCYTSGTTGAPKGVLYSHRSNVLHTFMTIQPDAFSLSARDTILPIVPMYHANAWGLVYAAPAVGARLVLPGGNVGGTAIADLVEREGVTIAFAVPTVWIALVDHLKAAGRRLPTLKRGVVGGAPCSERLMRDLDDLGITATPAWGMTELSPVGTVGTLPPELDWAQGDDRLNHRVKQGRPLLGVSIDIVDEAKVAVPHDGRTQGRLVVAGPCVARRYFGDDRDLASGDRGQFDTGDIATIDPDGVMRITDRGRDMIKSGGEWISPGVLELAAQDVSGVEAAAVIAMADERWDERPLMFISASAIGPTDMAEAVRAHLVGRFPHWMVPDRIVVVDEMPLGPTGKIDKAALRGRLG